MYYKETVTLWQGIRPHPTIDTTNGTYVVLNTNRINNLKVRASTKAKFNYSINPWDRREKPAYLQGESSVTTVSNAFDTTFNSYVLALPVFENDDTSVATVLRRIHVDDLAFAIADPDSANRSYVWYTTKAFGLVRVLVDYSLDQLVDVADTGNTTTTSTTGE